MGSKDPEETSSSKEEGKAGEVSSDPRDLTGTIELNGLVNQDIDDSETLDIKGDILESAFGQLIQMIPIPTLLVDGAYRIATVNRACRKIVGDCQEIIGAPFRDLLPAGPEAEKAQSSLEKAFAERQQQICEGLVVAGEGRIWSRISMKTIRIMGTKFALVLAEDLTLEKERLFGEQRHSRELREELGRRLAAERKLRESERRFRTLVETMNESLAEVDENGVFTYVNRKLTEMLGYAKEEIIGRARTDLLAGPDSNQAKEWFAQGKERGVGTYECVLRGQGGREVPVIISSQPIYDPDGRFQGVVDVLTDITEQKKAEHALRDSEQRLQLAVEGASLSLWDWNIQTGEMVFSKNAAEMLGYAPDEISPHYTAWGALVHPDDQRSIRKAFNAHVKGETPVYENEHRLRHRSGRWIWNFARGRVIEWDGSGNPLRMIGVNFDITDRKEAEQALRESEEKYRELAELLPQFIFEIDEKGRFTFLNRSGLEAGGCTQEDVDRGLSPLEVIVPEDVEAVAQDMAKALRGEKLAGLEYTALRKDGTTFPVIGYFAPILKDRQPVGIRGVGVDISDLKAKERQIQESLKEKVTLLSEIHHRVKNNLQIMSSMLAIQSEYRGDDPFREVFEDIRNRIWSMALVHEGLYGSDNLSEINADHYLRRLLTGVRSAYWMTRHRVAVKIDVEDISLELDTAVPCGLIINELFTNALKHAFPGERHGEIRVSLGALGKEQIVLEVSDDGIGLPEELDIEDPKSFGLNLVSLLTQQLRGDITLDRSAGTRYHIRLRRAELRDFLEPQSE